MNNYKVRLKEEYKGCVDFKDDIIVSADNLDKAHMVVKEKLGWPSQKIIGYLEFVNI